jgi:AcrR family transcriptional regulator/DNA-binding MarR family transcriptional regulator
VQCAGISRRTFYELFDDCQDCLVAAIDRGLLRASERVLAAYRGDCWHERIRASLAVLLRFLDEEPIVGYLLVVGTLAVGPRALERRQRVLDQITLAVDAGRREPRASAHPPLLAAEGTVGAAFAVIHGRMLQTSHKEPLIGLLNPLMSMIVLPYLGTSAARREAHQPPAHPTTVPSPHSGLPTAAAANPLSELGIRLTYRTILTLRAIAAQPNSSNKTIAEAAGITDQGQISKLLTRLQKFGLIHNTGTGAALRGDPNAWTLTPTGQQIHQEITNDITTT